MKNITLKEFRKDMEAAALLDWAKEQNKAHEDLRSAADAACDRFIRRVVFKDEESTPDKIEKMKKIIQGTFRAAFADGAQWAVKDLLEELAKNVRVQGEVD